MFTMFPYFQCLQCVYCLNGAESSTPPLHSGFESARKSHRDAAVTSPTGRYRFRSCVERGHIAVPIVERRRGKSRCVPARGKC